METFSDLKNPNEHPSGIVIPIIYLLKSSDNHLFDEIFFLFPLSSLLTVGKFTYNETNLCKGKL